jgi:hypothetical protein
VAEGLIWKLSPSVSRIDALLASWLEDIMKALMRSRMSLFTVCAAAFVGGLS